MRSRRLHAGIVRALVLSTLVLGVAFLQVQNGSTPAQAGSRGFVPTNPKLHVSSIRQAAQHYLVDQAKQTAAVRSAVQRVPHTIHGDSASYPGDCTGYAPYNAPGGANIWNKDACDMLQSEESIALNLSATASGNVVGGVNDFSGFFGFNADNPLSITGYTVAGSGAGGSIRNWGDLPGKLDPSCTDGSVLDSFGDPYVGIATSDATAYISSLAIPNSTAYLCANGNSDNGILVNKSTANLYTTGACVDHELSSNCWTPVLIAQANVSGCPTNSAPCQFFDKESLAVDNTASSPGYGNVYVAFDIIDNAAGSEIGVVVGCNHTLSSCSAPIKYSGTSLNEFSPSVAVRADGSIEIGYESFDTTVGFTDLNLTLCTITGNTPSCNAPTKFDSINSAITCSTTCDATNDQLLQGLATNGLRILTQVKIAVDDTAGANKGHTYAVWDQCATNENYLGLLCGAANVAADDIPTPTATGTRITFIGGRYDDFMPTVAVDQTNGFVYMAYYSTKTDLVTLGATPSSSDTGNHTGIRPFITRSSGGTGGFSAPYGLTTANDSYQADQCVQSGCVPQFGDYFQIVANGGKAYVHFNVNFKQKGGPKVYWDVNGPVNQEDNYMCRVLTFPPSSTFPCS